MPEAAEVEIKRYPYDEATFYEVVLYIADAFKDDPNFGRIKLAKLIYNVDFRAMRELGRPITGVTYIKDTFGHNPVQLLMAELDLQAEGLAVIVIGDGEEEPRFIRDDDRRRLIPKANVQPQRLTSDARALVDAVIEEYRTAPAKAMSDESHKTVGWEVARWRKEIPIESAFLVKPTARELKEGRAVAKRLGLAN